MVASAACKNRCVRLAGAISSLEFDFARRGLWAKVTLLLLLTLYTAISSCVYFGWLSMTSLLYGSGAYENLCSDSSNRLVSADVANTLRPKCDAQEIKVNSLFLVIFCVHSLAGAIAGVVMHFLGLKMTAMLGQLFNIAAWFTFSVASASVNVYMLGAILLGLGAGTTFLPTLFVLDFFPSSGACVLTIIGAAASASYCIPLIMEKLWYVFPTFTFFQLCWGYIIFGLLPAILGAALLIPWWPLKNQSHNIDDCERSNTCSISSEKPETKRELTGSTEDARCSCDTALAFEEQSKECTTNLIGEHRKTLDSVETSLTSFDSNFSKSDTQIDEEYKFPCKKGEDTEAQLGGRFCDTNNQPGALSQLVENTKVQWYSGLRAQIFSWEYFLIIVYSIIVTWACSYIQLSAARLYPSAQSELLRYLLPFSFIPSIFLGYMIDTVGIGAILLAVNFFGVLTYALTFTDSPVLLTLSVICFCIYESVQTSQMFCFIEKTFSPNHFQKLIGLCCMLSGLFSLALQPVYTAFALQDVENAQPVAAFIAAILIFTFVPLTYNLVHVKRNPTRFQNIISSIPV